MKSVVERLNEVVGRHGCLGGENMVDWVDARLTELAQLKANETPKLGPVSALYFKGLAEKAAAGTERAMPWRYLINYGPDGEENYANVYTPDGKLVGNLRINHAIAIVDGLNAAKADRPHVATPAPGENSERANLELRLTELANAIERKSPSLTLHDSRLVREAIRSLSTSYAAGRRSMRKKAARVVSQARFGEIDSDLRSILAAIRAIPEK